VKFGEVPPPGTVSWRDLAKAIFFTLLYMGIVLGAVWFFARQPVDASDIKPVTGHEQSIFEGTIFREVRP
jgi:hypothetical protein